MMKSFSWQIKRSISISKEIHIEVIKNQEVSGIDLFELKDKKPERRGVLGGPAVCIVICKAR